MLVKDWFAKINNMRHQHSSTSSPEHVHNYEVDAKVNPLWGTQREIALSENIISVIKNKSGSILDVGCGDGYLLHVLRKLYPGLDLVGVDISSERLSHCKKNVSNVRLIQSEVEKMPFPTQSFDTVICSEVIEHVSDPMLALQELWRVTNKQLIVTVPNDQPTTQIQCPKCTHEFYLSGHLRQINSQKLYEWGSALNPRNIEIKKFHTIFTYNKITLGWPKKVRKVADSMCARSERLLSFMKPNFLMISLEK